MNCNFNMLFLFPKKKIVLDCFTYSKAIIETAPIHNAIKHIPEWWKRLPNVYYKNMLPYPTMKFCTGMVDYYTNSIALPLWSDLIINVNSNKTFQWQFSDGVSEAQIHDPQQAPNLFNDHYYLKLATPWLLKTKKDIKWLWSQPIYSFSSDIANLKILPGMLNFYHQHAANVNMLIPLNEPKQYLLQQGQVLAHLTLLSEYNFKVVRHLIDKSEYTKMFESQSSITFINKYKNIIKQKKKFSDCPYKKD